MERKIGEIFEYNGEWYQCLEEKYCNGCVFRDAKCDDVRKILGNCSVRHRSDKKSVIFKKLEKVGEPITVKSRTFQELASDNNSCKECVFNVPNKACCKNSYIEGICDDNGFWVEIKQSKEDMEEKYSELIDIVHEYMDKDMTYEYFKEAINYWVDDYNKSNRVTDKFNLKPFNLEKAKAGKSVCTRDGRKARIICFDAKDTQPIIGLYEKNIDGIVREYLCSYHTDGRMYDDQDTGYDLMMLPEKKEGWVNVYKGGLLDVKSYPTKKEAFDKSHPEGYVDTVKVCWEE